MKTILVFVNGNLIKQINYRTKREAKGNYSFYKKYGIADPHTGLRISNATFELI